MNLKTRIEKLEQMETFANIDVSKLSDQELEAIGRSPGVNLSLVPTADLLEMRRLVKSDPVAFQALVNRLDGEGLISYNK